MNYERLEELRKQYSDVNLLDMLYWGRFADHSGYIIKPQGECINWLCDRAYREIKNHNPNQDWIPLTIRHLETEEIDHLIAQAYSENPFAFIYDCELPEDGEEVFVTLEDGTVSTDSFVRDPFIGSMGYFERYCEEGEVVAWMHKPEPYKSEEEIKE